MKTTGVSCKTKFGLLVFLGHPSVHFTFTPTPTAIQTVLIKTYHCTLVHSMTQLLCTFHTVLLCTLCTIRPSANTFSLTFKSCHDCGLVCTIAPPIQLLLNQIWSHPWTLWMCKINYTQYFRGFSMLNGILWFWSVLYDDTYTTSCLLVSHELLRSK